MWYTIIIRGAPSTYSTGSPSVQIDYLGDETCIPTWHAPLPLSIAITYLSYLSEVPVFTPKPRPIGQSPKQQSVYSVYLLDLCFIQEVMLDTTIINCYCLFISTQLYWSTVSVLSFVGVLCNLLRLGLPIVQRSTYSYRRVINRIQPTLIRWF